ncbi:MAG: motility protein A [Pirellulales bacterium]|nr:motility protein A [Pirellulales bacterium]
MDISSVVGLLLGIILLVAAIAIAPGSSFGAFIDYPSLMVVVGGAIAATLISFPLKTFLSIFGVLKTVFLNKTPKIPELIEQIVQLAETARREGLLALEAKLEDVDNAFIVLGVQMAVDGTPQEITENVMRTEMEAVFTRHKDGKSLFDALGRFGPAFGMIGTLMGLIIMLGNMSDPSSIGSGMAVALITTLYGAIFSNLFCLPMADKLGFLNKLEVLAMEITIRGIAGIQNGDNPRVIQQTLNTYVPPKQRPKEEEAA